MKVFTEDATQFFLEKISHDFSPFSLPAEHFILIKDEEISTNNSINMTQIKQALLSIFYLTCEKSLKISDVSKPFTLKLELIL